MNIIKRRITNHIRPTTNTRVYNHSQRHRDIKKYPEYYTGVPFMMSLGMAGVVECMQMQGLSAIMLLCSGTLKKDHVHLHCHKHIINSSGNPSKLLN
jgi:ribulose kinase